MKRKGRDKLTSIVILSYNTKEYLQQCIASIRRYTEADSYEMIVVDNASTDGSAEWLREEQARSADLRVLFTRENTGSRRAAIRGWRQREGRRSCC